MVLKHLGAYLYPVTIVISITAIAMAILHAIHDLGSPTHYSVVVMNFLLAIEAAICVVYLWEKKQARYASMVYCVGWTTSAVLGLF